MEPISIYIIIGLVCLMLGYFLGNYIQALKTRSTYSALEERELQSRKRKTELEEMINEIQKERDVLRSEKEKLGNQIVRYRADLENLSEKNREQRGEVEKLQEKFTKEFENLANRILEEKSDKFTKRNKENIENILNPLKEKIKNFEDKVDQTHKESIDYHSALRQQIFGLKELNQQLGKEANNLTKALKGDSKAQGNWGELVLENVLEKSNLVKDREYFIQQSILRVDGSRVMPDVIIQLPDGKKMIIDSKVSLTAYEKYTSSEEKHEKKLFLKEHIKSIKIHIEQLSQKKYEDIYQTESPDFILMFVPVEPALYLAQNEDNDFFYTAFNKNILLVSPTTLLSVLRTIDTLWKNEKQQQNAVEIAKHAASLYTKFKNLLDDLEIVGNRIRSTSIAYEGAMKKLTGNQNLIKDIDKLEKLGISPKDKINRKWIDRAEEEDRLIVDGKKEYRE